MRHSASRRAVALLCAVVATLSLAAKPQLHKLTINVDLRDNGDAEITELRQMGIDDEGTECYIVIGNLGTSTITDFYVTDENGRRYTNVGEWNVKRSREWKAGKCGIVTKSDGYELCWGLGQEGVRFYKAHYVVTDLVRSYEESDGFNWMFVTRDMDPSPMRVEMEITASCREDGLPSKDVGVWTFGHRGGSSQLVDSMVVVSKSGLTPEESIIVMMELKKGLLHPKASGTKATFAEVRQRAFEGSDYSEEGYQNSKKEPSMLKKVWNVISGNLDMLLGLLFIGALMVWAMMSSLRKRRERKKLLANLEWYRQVPANGDLVRARHLMGAFYNTNPLSFEDLVNAMVLQLIRTEALRIEDHYVDATGLKKMFGGEGKVQQCIVIGNFDPSNRFTSSVPVRKLFEMFQQSAGEDGILQPRELRRWMKHHEMEVKEFIESTDKGSLSLKEGLRYSDDASKVFGLKKFLEDFTLANERHLSELGLWKDYLVYATLFGIADQVKADMKQINPEYMQMDQVIRNLTNNTVVPALYTSTFASISSVKHDMERSRDSGGGGSSSFGGGGGFSGGGSGGGVR